VLLLLLIQALGRPADPRAEAKIDAGVFAAASEARRASFLVVLREQPDLSGAAAIGDRVERRRFVFDTLRAQAEASQGPLAQMLARAGVAFRGHFLVNMIEVEGDRSLALALASRDDVAAIAPNRGRALSPPPVSPTLGHRSLVAVEPNIQQVRAPELWSRGFLGQGIVVGIADTGSQWDHPALKNAYRGWNGASASHDYHWHDAIHDAAPANPCGSDAAAPCDDDGHGTATAGLAVGGEGAGNQIGVAPGARWIGCRNMDRGVGTPARYTECFEWFLAPTDSAGDNPRPDLAADVINNSWACPASEGCTDPNILKAVVENVRAAGIAVVFAAGNGGASCSTINEVPAIYDASFSIGATDANDRIAGFSSLGPVTIDGSHRLKPDLTAPGVNVRTAAPGGTYTSTFSGTSAASPQVAGAVALLWSAISTLAGDVTATELALEGGAVPLTLDVSCGGLSGLNVPNPIFGWGRLDVEGAYEWLEFGSREAPIRVQPPNRPDPRALSPRP
jgi:serine protease AprX